MAEEQMDLNSFWKALGRSARWGLALGLVAIVSATVLLGYWALRTDYEVLFAKLSAQDASAMTRELDQMKVPYRLGEDGTTILVDRSNVHATRLKLMGKDLPLHGAVGFELFNNTDFGMTEFAQKVNYQRALQGELTRTILSLAEVESARVHLAFPEEGLFKRETSRTKASITLTLHDGKALRREQVRGIQRLVAAAVPGIESRDVTLVSDQGVALTQEGDEAGSAGSLRMDLKRDVEQYLTHKANALLEKAFGPGQALASVDVTLDMNQLRVTTEDVTTPPSLDGAGPVGVVVRERETVRDNNKSNPVANSDGAAGSTHREVDYQLGRRVEQTVSSPGAITRLQALAVLRTPLNPAQVEQVKQLLASAVGANRDRGDIVVIQSLDGLAANISATAPAGQAAAVPDVPTAVQPAVLEAPSARMQLWPQIAALALVVLALLAALTWQRRRHIARAPVLDKVGRDASLAQLKIWLAQSDSGVSRGEGL